MTSIHLSVVRDKKKFGVLVYDLARLRLIDELSDYAAAMTRRHRDELTVLQELGYLKEFWAYLDASKVGLADIEDDHLMDFAQKQVIKVMEGPRSRGSEAMAAETVNAKLRRVYHWLHWLQFEEIIPQGTVGVRGQVRSSIGVNRRRGRGHEVLFDDIWARGIAISHPVQLPVAGGRSKHHISKEVPTEAVIDRLYAHFHASTDEPYLAHRNCLFVDVANGIGLRRGSISSLFADQFENVKYADEEFWVRPARQKFAYVNSFPLPVDLAWRVQEFIQGPLADFIKRKNIPSSKHQGRLILSARGTPLTDRAMSQIVSRGLRAAGMGRGVAIHAFRTKFTSEEIYRETELRKEAGLDTSARSVAQAVALKIGQKRWQSLFPYAVSAQARQARRDKLSKESEISELRAEVRKLISKLAAAERKLNARTLRA